MTFRAAIRSRFSGNPAADVSRLWGGVGWRTDPVRGSRDSMRMNKPLRPATTSLLNPLLLALAALALAVPGWQIAQAQTQMRAPVSNSPAALSYLDGLAMQHRGDEKGALVAFTAAAEGGYPPAQRRLGEIYDSGNAAVERDYSESIRWFERAREGGEQIPAPKSPMPTVNSRP